MALIYLNDRRLFAHTKKVYMRQTAARVNYVLRVEQGARSGSFTN